MAQKIYAVALDKPEPAVEERLKDRYTRVFKHTDTLLFVVGGANDISEDLAVAAGIKGEQREVDGVVFRLRGSYSGYTKSTLWEWMKDATDG